VYTARAPRVLVVDEQERFRATGGAQRVVSGSQESATDPAAGVGRMNEQQEHLTIGWVSGCVADDTAGFVDGDEQHVRRLVIGDELIPVLRREQGLGGEVVQVGPARADGGVEYRSDGRRV
jgi:hypothetical protein